jgi:uncharacterized membrane protein
MASQHPVPAVIDGEGAADASTLGAVPRPVEDIPSLSAPRPDDLPSLSAAARALALLFVEGASCAFAIWLLRVGPRLISYVSSNDLGPRGRTAVLADMAAGGLVAAGAAIVYLIRRRRHFAPAARRVHEVATRLGPLVTVGLLPLLFDWRLWAGREMVVLSLATIFALGLQGLTRAALLAPPLWRPRRPFATLRIVSRFGARHARLAGALPLALVIAGSLAYAALFSWATILNHHSLRTTSFDLGLEENVLWNALHWNRPLLKSSPFGGPHGTVFGWHATFISYPLALLYGIAQRAETLLVIQAVAIGGAAIPLFLYTRRHLGAWGACVIGYVYLLYPPVHSACLYDFHYLSLGAIFLWSTLYAVDARRPVMAVVFAVFTLAVREDIGAGLAIVGGYLLLTGQRPRAGLAVGIVGALYFVIVKLIVMPHYLKGDAFISSYRDMLPSGDPTFSGVLKTAIANPAYTLNTLLDRDKVLYVMQLFVPLAFVPLRRPIGFFCCTLGFFFTLLSTGYPPFIQTSFHYTANWTAYIFIAIVGNLVWVTRPRTPGDTEGPVRRKAWLVGLAAATLVCSYQFGAAFQRHTIRGGFGRYTFGTTDLDREHLRSVQALIKHVPRYAKIVASETLVPQVSNRPDAYTLRVGIYDAEYLLFLLPIGGQEQANALPVLTDGSFGVMEIREPFVLAKRGYKTDQNQAIIARMR